MTKSTPSSAAQPPPALPPPRAGEPHRLPVHRLQVALAAHVTQLLPVRVVGQRHHHVRARAQELAMQLTHGVRVVEYHLGHERARLDVAAPLQLEDVALGAEHRARTLILQPVHDRRAHATLQLTHETHPFRDPPAPGRREAPDVVHGALLQRELGQHPAYPGRELAAGWRTAYSGVSIWAACRALLRRSCG